MSQHRLRRVFGLCAALAAAGACGLVLLWPMDPGPYLDVKSSGEVHDHKGRLLCAFLNEEEQWCFARDLDDMSSYVVQATLAAEDRRFYRHFGVDPVAVARAAWQNVREGRVVSGASTITMQVVKRKGGPRRSLWGKAVQAVQAVRLERRATKDEILRAYLNTAPYGLNLVGCEAAARRYFGKPARELTLAEAALLAGLPKAPTAYMPLSEPGKATARRNHVLARMRDDGFISDSEYRSACAAPLTALRHELPALSRHLAMRMKSSVAGGEIKRTTLDADIQRKAERLVRDTIRGLDGKIGNAALLVVDVDTASILARVSSADFFDTPGGGQVDACRAPRSPGSALKPFIYAAAMENDVLYGSEMLLDSALDYGLYSPENADGTYRGLTSATTALRRSLNVPAVLVLERLGVETAHSFLRNAGLRTLTKPAEHYGLGMALGDCEVCLEDLAAAYCMLAYLGEYRPLQTLADAPPAARPVRRLSRGVCLHLYEMLEQPLPDEFGPDVVRASGVRPRVCWKTGTSTGQRDAWAVVFNRHYLVAVWMGNNDGSPSRWLVGSRAALPLAGRMFRALPLKPTPAWPDSKEDARMAEVCAASGLPASPWCPHTRSVALPRGQYLHRMCDVHHPVRETSGETRIMERWPGSTKGWDLAHVRSPVGPALERSSATTRVAATRIVEPADQAEFILTGEDLGDRIKLRSSAEADSVVHWYLDNRYLGASSLAQPLYIGLEQGSHKLACMSARGETDTVHFRVLPPRGEMQFRK